MKQAEKNPADEHANIAVCHYWLSKIYLAAGRLAECVVECDLMKTYQFDDDSKKLLAKYFDEIDPIKKNALSGRRQKGEIRLGSKTAKSR